ncbi:MAG: 1-acyl-sn-glycerol-3-phosphate acyltransferase [Actinomycetia bacterium]|nr:1-acyl-sn-glycerol-3-phosphate acyltransferase [Actinomycetes bacterium]
MRELKTKIADFFFSIPRVLFINFFKLFVRIRVFDQSKIPKDSSAILAINHTTGADPIVLLGAVRKKIYFIASAKNFGSRFTNFFMRRFANSFPIHKEHFMKNAATFKELFIISRKKNVLFGVYPEGRLNKEGKLDSFKRGAAYLSYKTRLPIIPIYIHNLRRGVHPDSFIARSNVAEGILSIIINTFQRINVFIGDPINPTAENIIDDFKGLADAKNYKATIDEINQALAEEFSGLQDEADDMFSAGDEEDPVHATPHGR